jgi:protocatechuate 3,4-dioxygenase alpha subunit
MKDSLDAAPSAAIGGHRYPETASQTGGPYVHIGLAPQQAGFDIFENNFGATLHGAQTQGQRIAIEGQVFDGSGSVLRDVLLEIWQANAAGKYAHAGDLQDKPLDPQFRGWGRAAAHFETGLYRFDTIKPGSVAGRKGQPQAPHINVWVVARGINMGLHTRLYFSDEAAANAADPVLNGIEWETRRATLVAQRAAPDAERDGLPLYRFDIRLQGEGETVFFDI